MHAQVQKPMARLRTVATLLAVGLTAIHLGLWVLIYVQLADQISLVNDLTSIGGWEALEGHYTQA